MSSGVVSGISSRPIPRARSLARAATTQSSPSKRTPTKEQTSLALSEEQRAKAEDNIVARLKERIQTGGTVQRPDRLAASIIGGSFGRTTMIEHVGDNFVKISSAWADGEFVSVNFMDKAGTKSFRKIPANELTGIKEEIAQLN